MGCLSSFPQVSLTICFSVFVPMDREPTLSSPRTQHNDQPGLKPTFQGPWVSRTLTTMPQHFLITDRPFAFCKVPKQFFSTPLHFNILQKGHRTQKGQNKVTVTSSWFLPYCQPYNSCNVSSKNLVSDQLIISKLIFFLVYFHHLSSWYCFGIVRRNSVWVTHGSWRLNSLVCY